MGEDSRIVFDYRGIVKYSTGFCQPAYLQVYGSSRTVQQSNFPDLHCCQAVSRTAQIDAPPLRFSPVGS